MKKTLFVLLLTAVIFGCNKEEKISKNLWGGDGIWNIETYEYESTSSYFSEDNVTENLTNMGTLRFNEDGTGLFVVANDGGSEPFTYTNTSDKLVISYLYSDEGKPKSFDMDWKKNKMDLKLNSSKTYTSGDGAGGTVEVVFTERIHMVCTKN